MSYDFRAEAQRLIEAIDPRRGATTTVVCTLHEAYDAGAASVAKEGAFVVVGTWAHGRGDRVVHQEVINDPSLRAKVRRGPRHPVYRWDDALRLDLLAPRAAAEARIQEHARQGRGQGQGGNLQRDGHMSASQEDDLNPLGLNVCMLDVDRLRDWARLIEDDPLITRWGQQVFVANKMRDIAERLEKEIKDVGELRRLLRERQEVGYGHGV